MTDWKQCMFALPLGMASAFFSFKAEAKTSEGAQGPWGIECRSTEADGKTCVLEQSLSHQGKWLATLRIAPEQAGARMQVQLPTGIHLASGLFYSVDKGRDLALEFLRCDEDRCYAYRALSEQEFKSIQRGKTMTLRLRPEVQMPPVAMQVSLSGVTALSQKALK